MVPAPRLVLAALSVALVACETPSSAPSASDAQARTGPSASASARAMGTSPPPTRPSAPTPPTRPVTWQRLTILGERPNGGPPASITEVFPDGRVVFSGGRDPVATVAHAPGTVMDAITAWSSDGPHGSPDAGGTKEYVTRVRLQAGNTREAAYPYNAMPQADREIVNAVSNLINTPREPAPCVAWDGKGDFTLTLSQQDFGYVPGAYFRSSVEARGAQATWTRAKAGGGSDAPLVPSAPVALSSTQTDALRAAIVAVDLGHFREIHGGSGEGSNPRGVVLTTSQGVCGRSFTNQYPKEMKPLLDVVSTIGAQPVAPAP